MKFALGYQQLAEKDGFTGLVRDYRDSLAEVFFPWNGVPSGRTEKTSPASLSSSDSYKHGLDPVRMKRDLAVCKEAGLKLDLLFNGNCYGHDAVSRTLKQKILGILAELAESGLLPEIVTTTSTFIAKIIRDAYPGIELRASVNSRCDALPALEYLADLFDSFYLRRDHQRDLEFVRTFHRWTSAHGKKLCLLANSGCLRFCPDQIFHDNLVAHDAEIDRSDICKDLILPLCRRHYTGGANAKDLIRGSWIRPEDIGLYEPYTDVVKLATRVNANPRKIVEAYVKRDFDGNLLSLLEPDLAPLFAPYIIDNKRFPADFFTSGTGGKCAMLCSGCGKCEAVLKQVLIKKS